MTRTRNRRAIAGLWWLAPAGAVGLVVIPTLVLAWLLDDGTYRLAWRTPKALQTDTVALLLAGTLVFMIVSLIPLFSTSRRRLSSWPGWSDDVYRRLERTVPWLFWGTIFGYAALGASGLRNGVRPSDILDAVVGQNTYSGDLKTAFAPIAGVTTLTQLGIAFTVVATILLFRRYSRGLAWSLAVVLVLALARAFLLTERLAILELVIPALVVAALHWRTSPKRWVRTGVRAGPVALIPAVVLVFGVFEFSRSWVFFAGKGTNFFEFVVQRFSGYYVTAYNNGQLVLTYEHVPGSIPFRTLEALWTAPVIDQMGLFDRLSGPVRDNDFGYVIAVHGNPEFNNPCGICAPFSDWGVGGGLVLLATLGIILGVTYAGFASGSLFGTLLYPPLVTGLFELPRYLYWAQGRLVPAMVGLAIVGVWVRQRAQRGPPDSPVGGPPARVAADS